MAAFRLSRNVTLAMLVVTSSLFSTLFLVLSPSQSRAGTTPPPAAGQAYVVAQPSFCDKLIADPNSARQSFDLLCKGKGTTCVETALSKKIEECMKMATGSQSEQKDCNSSYEKFVENNGKMNAACGGAGIDGDCFAHVNKCLKCQGTDVNYSDCASLDTEDVKEDVASINDLMGFGSRTSTSVKYTPDPEKASIRYKNCPAMAGADLKDWISRVKDAQSASADAKRKIVDLTEKSNDIESQLRDTKIEKEKEMQDTVSEAEDVRQEMNNQLDEEKNKARQTISQLLEQSSEIENQIIATQKAYDDAYGTYLNALSALDQQCHAAALQKLTALQSMKQAKIDKSNYSTSSFNRLLGQVGLSSRRVAQKRVNEDFRMCKNDPAYKASVASAKRSLDSARKSANNAIQSLQGRKNQISLTIQDATNRELPETLQRVIANTNRTLAKLQVRLQQLATELQAAVDDANKKIAANNQNIAIAKNEADVAEQTLLQYQAYLNKKMVASGGVETDAQKLSEAMSMMAMVRSSAEFVVASCGCDKNSGGSENTKYCKSACEVLVKSHDEWDPARSITSDTLKGECPTFSSSSASSVSGTSSSSPSSSTSD